MAGKTQSATGFDASRSSLAAFLCGVARNHALRIRAASARFDELPDDPPSAADADADTVSDALAHLLARERATPCWRRWRRSAPNIAKSSR